MLNVVVLRQQAGAELSQHAQVRTTVRNLAGMRREVAKRKVEENGYVSYLGTYEAAPREVLDFRIEARPRGSGETPALRYRDRAGS